MEKKNFCYISIKEDQASIECGISQTLLGRFEACSFYRHDEDHAGCKHNAMFSCASKNAALHKINDQVKAMLALEKIIADRKDD